MPRWTPKEERQYKRIVEVCTKAGKATPRRCKAVAAATVNVQQKKRHIIEKRLGRALRRLKKK